MAEKTGIAWCDSTFNPWVGCTKVGPGCDHCYAEALDKRHRWQGDTHWGVGKPRMRTSAANWRKPLAWNKAREKDGKPHRVFCASLADVFDNEVDPEWRAELWSLIGMTPRLSWQLVTKRVGNVMRMVPPSWTAQWPAYVWIIATVVNQEEFDRDWPKLREVPARVRGLSIEPMLGPIRFSDDVRGNLHWAIYGGESEQAGVAARPLNVGWVALGIDQCRRLGIAPFVKQFGHNLVGLEGKPIDGYGKGKRADPAAWPSWAQVQEFPNG